ncbi:hypothetical protein QWZ10_23280 [Paracoccus cavernae]|uniref:Uncharacterized protein n=1 Tax=Paracoccus cavernae TaxID=1571207 RepID=A0ABT8DDZ1_9RHOB|nr:hypothetical protein [Paracoccus cavernae]
MSDRSDGGDRSRMPDAVDQRVDECTGGLYGASSALRWGFGGR